MRKLLVIGVGLFMMGGFLPAKENAVTSNIECIGSTCGVVICFDYGRELTNDERAWFSDTMEQFFCDNGD